MRSSRDLKTLTTPTEEMPEPYDHCQESYRIPARRSFRQIIDSANACSFDEGQESESSPRFGGSEEEPVCISEIQTTKPTIETCARRE
jgi:hypothetical protein